VIGEHDFSIFGMAAVCHLGFLNLQIFVRQFGFKANMHHHIKFHQNQSNRCGIITLNYFQNGGYPSCIFQKFNISMVPVDCTPDMCLTEISHTVAEI